jgi:hypothetical protein
MSPLSSYHCPQIVTNVHAVQTSLIHRSTQIRICICSVRDSFSIAKDIYELLNRHTRNKAQEQKDKNKYLNKEAQDKRKNDKRNCATEAQQKRSATEAQERSSLNIIHLQ